MLSPIKKFAIIVVVVWLAAAGIWSPARSDGPEKQDPYYQAMKNIKLFGQIYQEINDRYIEEIDAEKFIRAGIDGMIDRLDPYSAFLEQDSKDELEIITRGKYFGVGMRIQLRNGWATVGEQPFPESPAFRAGIREGDQIIEIDGKTTKGEKLSETAHRLRGTQKGSEVTIKIQRVGDDKPLAFTLIRDEIKVTDIQFSGFVAPGIGLIKLTSFDRGAGEQLRQEIQRLKDQGLQALIFDLRGNPGGLLDAAAEVAENFVGKGDLIVYTAGRGEDKKQEYRSQQNPVLGTLPLAVLVDGYTASSSEIVTGAIQDLDRGVIVGSLTFGKGLVQTVIPLDRRGDAQLKITTMQYFMPSGRCIQKPDVFDRGPTSVFVHTDTQSSRVENPDEEEDSEPAEKNETPAAKKDAPKFHTRNNRLVLGEGGILPDIEVKPERANRYEIELLRKSMIFNYSLDYIARHPDLKKDFVVDDAILNDFNSFCEAKKFDYQADGFDELIKLEKAAKERQFYPQIEKYLQGIKDEYQTVKQREREASAEYVKKAIRMEIAGKLFGRDEYWRVFFADDSAVVKGIEVLQNNARYAELLNFNAAKK